MKDGSVVFKIMYKWHRGWAEHTGLHPLFIPPEWQKGIEGIRMHKRDHEIVMSRQRISCFSPSSIGYLCSLPYILKLLSCSVSYRWYPTTFHVLRKEQCHFTSPLTLPFTYFPLSSFKPSVLLFLPGQDW